MQFARSKADGVLALVAVRKQAKYEGVPSQKELQVLSHCGINWVKMVSLVRAMTSFRYPDSRHL